MKHHDCYLRRLPSSAHTAACFRTSQSSPPQETASPNDSLASGNFSWRVSEPILGVDQKRLPESEHSWIAVKDPSIVRHGDMWHLFCTLRNSKNGDGRIRIGHLAFADWAVANKSNWHVLDLTAGYHGAPQIFYFEPHQKWYLIYQAEDETRDLKYGPCYSTNEDITDPTKWTKPQPLYVVPKGAKAGLDYWVICDKQKAHLFFTSMNGKMWRAETAIENFPNRGWTVPTVALTADIFEASHTYSLRGQNKYLTIVEAQTDVRRYFKGFLADRLDGEWTPLAVTEDKPLVSPKNVANQSESWATCYSHGEFIRSGRNQEIEIDPANLQLLFQGVSDKEYRTRHYGQIPWRLGILKQER